LEKKLKEEQTSYTKLTEDSNQAAVLASNKFDSFKSEMDAKVAQLETMLANEIAQKNAMQEKLSEELRLEKNTVTQLTRQKASVENDLAQEKTTSEGLREEFRIQKEINSQAKVEIAGLKKVQEDLKSNLERERESSAELRKLLEEERQGRYQDNTRWKELLEDTERKAMLERKAKQAVIKQLEGDKASLTSTLNDERAKSKASIEDLDRKLKVMTARESTLDAEFKALTVRNKEAELKVKQFEAQKHTLISAALNAQEAQRKLKELVDKFPKPEDLAKLLFGDLSFNTVMRNCSKYGLLRKQGGGNISKWQNRHVILNDIFMFYFSSPGDKAPKGVVRLDSDYLMESIDKVDLSKLSKEHAFKMEQKKGGKDDKPKRVFFFSAPSAEDCDEWILLLKQAREIKSYIGVH